MTRFRRLTSASSYELQALVTTGIPAPGLLSAGASLFVQVSYEVFADWCFPAPRFEYRELFLFWSSLRGWGLFQGWRVRWCGGLADVTWDEVSHPDYGGGPPAWALSAVGAAVPDPAKEALSLSVMES